MSTKTKLRDGDSLRCPYCHDDDFESTPSLRCHACRAWQHAECGDGKCGACGAGIGKKQESQDDLILADRAALTIKQGDGSVAVVGSTGPVNIDTKPYVPKTRYCMSCAAVLKLSEGLYCEKHHREQYPGDYCECGERKAGAKYVGGLMAYCEKCLEKKSEPKGPFIIPTAMGLAVARAIEAQERQRRLFALGKVLAAGIVILMALCLLLMVTLRATGVR